jgi:hypothetical protein
MWMHLDNGSQKIPSQLLNKSQILMDALSVAHPSVTRKVTVGAPKEWLEAWVACYCNEEKSLSCNNTKDLMNCLLVCFFLMLACVRTFAPYAVAVFTARRVLGSTLPFDSLKVISINQLLAWWVRRLNRSVQLARLPPSECAQKQSIAF